MPLNPMLKKMLEREMPSMRSLGVEGARAAMGRLTDGLSKVNVPIGSVENLYVKTEGRETHVRIYRPKEKGIHPVFIFIHGGGWVLGSIDGYDYICKNIVKKLNCTLMSIDYGLSPEHKFPEPVEECYNVIKWVHDNAEELCIYPDKIAVGGDSAGGNLSAAISILSRDRGEFSILYQVLIYPATDLTAQTQSKIENGKGLFLTLEDMEWFGECYLRDIEDAKNPMASPALAKSLKGLPPACIITAEYDPLRDEGELYAKKLIEAGVEVYHKRYDGVIHGFFNFQGMLDEAKDALSLVCERLEEAFEKSSVKEYK